jgi:hypothetical protein
MPIHKKTKHQRDAQLKQLMISIVQLSKSGVGLSTGRDPPGLLYLAPVNIVLEPPV